jgi:hypothetical protein
MLTRFKRFSVAGMRRKGNGNGLLPSFRHSGPYTITLFAAAY